MAKQSVSNNIKCPFCGTSFYRSGLSFVSSRFYLKRLKNRLEIYPLGKNVAASVKLKQRHPELIKLEMAACPNCHRITVRAVGIGDQYRHKIFNIYPRFSADPLPNYVPNQIRQDYKEAVGVLKISPNSAAMLSRRILEEIIVDFYHIQRGDLFHDLDELRHQQSSPRIWQAIDSIRRLGNIGAHQTHNVNNVFGNVSVRGANQIVNLIRMIIHDTYVESHLSRKLEKSVIRSAKKLNYEPHYYQGSDDDRYHNYRNYHNQNSNQNSRNRHRHGNFHHYSRKPRRNQQSNRGKRWQNQNRQHRNRHKKTRRSKARREQNSRARKTSRRRSTRHGRKKRIKDRSFTIIQSK